MAAHQQFSLWGPKLAGGDGPANRSWCLENYHPMFNTFVDSVMQVWGAAAQ